MFLCPVAPIVAPRHVHSYGEAIVFRSISVDGKRRPYLDQLSWNVLISAALLPAAVAPIGVTPTGLPVGAQIVSAYLDAHTTVAFTEQLTEVTGGYQPPPYSTSAAPP